MRSHCNEVEKLGKSFTLSAGDSDARLARAEPHTCLGWAPLYRPSERALLSPCPCTHWFHLLEAM